MSWTHVVELLGWLAATRGAQRYLELGVDTGYTFDRVPVPEKVGVDPYWGGTERMTAEAYFLAHPPGSQPPFDLVLVDAMHLWEHTLADTAHALARLSPQGAIVVHDVCPATEDSQTRAAAHLAQYATRPGGGALWHGDAWKAGVVLRTWADVDAATWGGHYGCLVVLPRANTGVRPPPRCPEGLTWADYARYGAAWLRVLDEAGLRAWVEATP